jgi:hypothetical protein
MAKRKVAMVAPPPAKKVSPPAKPAAAKAVVLSLEEILSMAGIDRPYTVISHQGNVWQVQFLGDQEPKTVKFENGKWIIK